MSNLNLPFRTKIKILYTVIFLLLILAVGITAWNYRSFVSQSQTEHSLLAQRKALNLFLSALKDTEMGQRGYLLSQNESYLAPYLENRDNLLQILSPLEGKGAGAEINGIASDIRKLALEKLDFIQNTILLEKSGNHGEAIRLLRTGIGKEKMDSIRHKSILVFLKIESELSSTRLKLKSAENNTFYSVVLLTIAAFSFLLFSYVVIRQEGNRRNDVEAKLLESESMLQRLIEAIPIGIFALKSDGTPFYANKAAKYLLGSDILSRANMGNLANVYGAYVNDTEELYPVEKMPIVRALRGESATVDDMVIHRGNTKIHVEVFGAPVKNKSGKVQYALASFHDISERKMVEIQTRKAKEEAETANLAKSQFLANMSHELRTPLNAIIGYSELILEEAADRSGEFEFSADVERIKNAGFHLLTLINDILDLSKIESGKLDVFLEEIQISPMLRSIEDTVKPLIQKNHNELKIEISDLSNVMVSDETKVRQCLLNLVSNATKFTENGLILIQVYTEQINSIPYIIFSVTDTGIGMTDVQMNRLFEAFVQADPSTTRKYGGTGLGLAITRRMAQLLGGDVQLESQLGEGSNFKLILPQFTEDYAGKNPRVISDFETTNSPGLENMDTGSTLLVIDDDEQIRFLIEKHANRYGMEAISVASGKEGVRLAKIIRPIAITLDIMMPDMDGWEVLRELKADPELAEIPVILITIVDNKSLGYSLGAEEYLLKPIRKRELVRVLQKVQRRKNPPKVLLFDDDPVSRAFHEKAMVADLIDVLSPESYDRILEYMNHSPDLDAYVLDFDSLSPADTMEILQLIKANSVEKDPPVLLLYKGELSEEQKKEYIRFENVFLYEDENEPMELVYQLSILLYPTKLSKF